jgi:hypothetical protein
VGSFKTILRRATVVELILALSILGGCSSDKVTSPVPVVPPPSTIDVVYCTGLQPDWVAFQDGDGAWIRGLPAVDGERITFRNTFTTDRAAIAVVRLLGNGFTSLAVQYSAPAELTTVGFTDPRHCGSGATSRTVIAFDGFTP